MSSATVEPRPLTASEAMWKTVNHSSSPLALVARLRGAVDVDDLESALAAVRARHPYLRAAVHKEASELGPSPLDAIPLSQETIPAFGCDENARQDAVHAAVRRQLLEGVRITETFVRAHLLSESAAAADAQPVHHLVLLGDHMALDARSFYSWLDSILTALAGGAPPGDGVRAGGANELLIWDERIPSGLELRPLDQVPTGRPVAPTKTPAAPAASDAGPVVVEDVTRIVPEASFAAVKRAAKTRGLTLNGPLFAAFARAAADLAVARGEEMPFRAAGACAVDLRTRVDPPLPGNFISSAAALANMGAEVAEGRDIWSIGSEAAKSLADGLAAGEGFRMPLLTHAGDYAALGSLFAVTCIWSNIGHYGGATAAGETALEQLEFHLMGEGSNPMVSVHLVETNGRLAVALTYSPAFHQREDMVSLADSFLKHLDRLAADSAE